MKTRKAPRKKTGSTRRAAKAAAPKRKTAPNRTAAPKRKAVAKRTAAPRRSAVRPLALPAECLIASATDLRTTFLKRLTDTGNVQIDVGAVQRVDTASLQVLAAFARDRRAGGLPLEWLGVSTHLTEAAALLDLTHTLGFQA